MRCGGWSRPSSPSIADATSKVATADSNRFRMAQSACASVAGGRLARSSSATSKTAFGVSSALAMHRTYGSAGTSRLTGAGTPTTGVASTRDHAGAMADRVDENGAAYAGSQL